MQNITNELEEKLFNLLNEIDNDTALSVKNAINSEKSQNKTLLLNQFINRLENALNIVDTRMIKATYTSVNSSAFIISKKIAKLASENHIKDQFSLIALFYEQENSIIQAPLIKQNKTYKLKCFETIQQ